MTLASMSLSESVIGISALLIFYCLGNENIFVECTNQGQGHVIILSNSLGAFDGGYDNSKDANNKGYSPGGHSGGAVSLNTQSQGFVSNQKSRRGLNGVYTVLQTNGHGGGKGQNVYQFQDANSFEGGLQESTQGRKARENPPVSSHVAIPLPDAPQASGGFGSFGKGAPNQGISYDTPQKHQMVPVSGGKGSSTGWQSENTFDGRVFYNGHQGVVSFPMESNKGGGNVQLNSKGGFVSPGEDSHKGRGGSIDYSKSGGVNQNSFNVGKGNIGNSGGNRFDVQGPGKGGSPGKGQSGPWDNKKGGPVDQVPQTKQTRTPRKRIVVIPVLKHVAVVEHVPVIEHIKVITDDDTLQGLDGKALSLGRSVYGGQLGANFNDGDDIAQGISGVDLQNLKGLSGSTALDGGGKDFIDTGSGKSLPGPSIPSGKGSHPGTTPRTKDYGGGSIQQDSLGDFGKGGFPSNVPSAGIHNVNEYRSGGKTFIIFHTTESGKGQIAQGGGQGGQKGFDTGSYGNEHHQVSNEAGNFHGNGKTNQIGTASFDQGGHSFQQGGHSFQEGGHSFQPSGKNAGGFPSGGHSGGGNVKGSQNVNSGFQGGHSFQQGGHSFQPSGKTAGGFPSGGHSGGGNVKGSQNVNSGFQAGNGFSAFNVGHEVTGSSLGGQKGTSPGFKGIDQGYTDAGWSGDAKNGGVNKGTAINVGVDFSGGTNNIYSGKGGPTGGKGIDFNNIGHQNKGGGGGGGGGISQGGKNVFPPTGQSFNNKGGGGVDIKGTNLGTGGGKNFPDQQLPKGNIVEGIDLRLIESLLAASVSSGKNKFNDAGSQQQLQQGKKSYGGGSGGNHKGNAKDFRSNKRSTDEFVDKSADGKDPRKFGGEMWW